MMTLLRKCLLVGLLVLATFAVADPLPRKGTLGVPLAATSEEVRSKFSFAAQGSVTVTKDTGDLKVGDVIYKVGGEGFDSFAKFNTLVGAASTGKSVKLTVKRGDTEIEITAAFQAKPADNTAEYETIYDEVLSKGNRVRTFVTRPKRAGKFPVFFFIQGIGLGSMDWPLATANVTAPLIKAFADDGYVTVRIEKPGIGDSDGGPSALLGWEEEVDIFRQGLKALEKYEFVDRDKVYVFGHSMGGCHAPIVCSEIPVKGIISYGTVSHSWLEWAIRAPRIQSILGGSTYADVDQEVRKISQFYSYLYTEKRSVAWIKENRPELSETADGQGADEVMLGQRSLAFMRGVNDVNFGEFWVKLGETRVLSLYGQFDWIALRECQTQVADMVNSANPGKGDFAEVPNSDHLFLECSSMKDSFDRFGQPGMFNPLLVTTIKDWIASDGE